MERNQFIELLFDRARQAGFEACDAYVLENSNFQTAVNKGELTRYSVSDSLNLGFRGLYRGKMGCASTQILDADAPDLLIAAAKSGAELIDNDDPEFIFPGSDAYPEYDGTSPAIAALGEKEKIAMTRELEERALAHDPRIASCSHCALFSGSADTLLVNSRGLKLHFHRDHLGAYVYPIARSGERTGTAGRHAFVNDPARLDLDKIAREAAGEAISYLDAASVPSGKYPVLLRYDAAADFLETFANVFCADAAQKGMSLLKGREGTQIAAPGVQIMDDPLIPGGYASAPFDDEGVASARTAVVQNGVLTTLLHNLKTAKKQGAVTTGNAARSTVAGPMQVAPANFYIASSELRADDLMRRAGRALLITDLMGMHSGANAISGDFSLGAKGYLIENGKVQRAVNQITIAGNFFDVLKQILAAGDDLQFGAGCYASPTLLIESLAVAGG